MFRDGFGPRFQTFDPEAHANDPIEILAFEPSLVEAPEFTATLGARVARLGAVRHTFYARVKRLDRPSPDSLHLVSDRVAGWRLAQVLELVERDKTTIDISAVLNLLRQLIPAVALFARHQRDLAVGAIGPERLILTPQARLVLTEYVLGPAIEKLAYTRERLWRDLRVAVPAGGVSRVSPRSDVLGIGIVVLSLLHGRLLRDDEYPGALQDLLQKATESSGGSARPLSESLSVWLGRALQLDARTAFQSPHEAQVAFEEMLATERSYVTASAVLDAFVANFAAIAGPPPEPTSLIEEPAVQGASAREEREEAAPPREEPALVSLLESIPPAEPASVRVRVGTDTRKWTTGALAGFALLVLIESITLIWLWNRWSSDTLAREGELVVSSLPPGARVKIDSQDHGATPLTVRLSPGTYTLEVQVGNEPPRVVVVQIRAGVQTAQYLELQTALKPPDKPAGTGKGRKN